MAGVLLLLLEICDGREMVHLATRSRVDYFEEGSTEVAPALYVEGD
jgi:hypothetical protein